MKGPSFVFMSLFVVLSSIFASCTDEPDFTEAQMQVIDKGQTIHASMLALSFYICNDFPEIYPIPGMSNYSDAPTIGYVGNVGQLNEVSINSVNYWSDRCEIIDKGGYIAKVKWYDPQIRDDKTGYLFMFVEIIHETQDTASSESDNHKIRVTYVMM